MLSRTMRRIAFASLCAGLLGLGALAGPARANVIIGSNDGDNCYPFACFASDGGTIYQEVYKASAFPSVLTIGQVSFFRNSGGEMDSATYNLSFYLAATPFGAQSSTLSDNLGSLLADWGIQSVGGAMPDTLTFTGTPFTYDPTAGDLLMQVTVSGITRLVGYGPFFATDYTGDSGVLRNFITPSGTVTNLIGALVTEFGPGPTPVPEPASLALFGIGLFGLAGTRLSGGRDRAAAG